MRLTFKLTLVAEIRTIEELISEQVVFHTVVLGENPVTEFQDFQQRMKALYPCDLSEINKFIEKIKENNSGAELRFFKRQDDAERLYQPTPSSYDKFAPDPKDYGLRLYAVWLSERTVFLLNGDKKTYRGVKFCPNCRPYFETANQIAKAIHTAKYMNEIEVDAEGYILIDEGYKLDVI